MEYEGLRADAMTDGQRLLLRDLVETYVGRLRDGHAQVGLDEVVRHLDETHFCWMGGTDDLSPFYYKVQSPVILIEFDHEPGVVFANNEPTRHHVHTHRADAERQRLRHRPPPPALRAVTAPPALRPAVRSARRQIARAGPMSKPMTVKFGIWS